jgi:predicted nucleic acid-binding Zn ribbon protein
MPTYVYRFLDSDETIEVQQAFTDDALTEAVNPSTGELSPVKKVFTAVGVTFKGSGFYKTDSRGKSSSSTSSGDTAGSPATKSDAKPESKSESKSETKSESKSESSSGKSDSSSSSNTSSAAAS